MMADLDMNDERKKIIFVDDEVNVLRGLRRMLHPMTKEWDLYFAESGADALDQLQRERCDIIITDMRMPEMNGIQLLAEVKERHPHIIRMMLTGNSEKEVAFQALPVAHQFLSKPCDPNFLRKILKRVCKVRDILHDAELQKVVGKMDKLPGRPKMYSQIMAALAEEDVSVKTIAQLIGGDMTMCIEILRMANSAYFGAGKEIAGISEAIIFLGMNVIKSFVLSLEVFESPEEDRRFPGFSPTEEQKHALAVSALAGRILGSRENAEAAVTGGLLHDVGKLVIARQLPDHMKQILAQMKNTGKTMYQTEKELYGVTHAEVGAYILNMWGLPYPVVEVVANHHEPWRTEEENLDFVKAVHIANRLTREQAQAEEDRGEAAGRMSQGYFEKMGFGGDIESWREECAKMLQRN